jgi:hypothetical protein
MALLHEGFSAGKSGLLLWSIRSTLWAAYVCTNQSHVFFVGCFSLGPRKNDLTNYWALGPFVRPFTSLVDPGDIYPPQDKSHTIHQQSLQRSKSNIVTKITNMNSNISAQHNSMCYSFNQGNLSQGKQFLIVFLKGGTRLGIRKIL